MENVNHSWLQPWIFNKTKTERMTVCFSCLPIKQFSQEFSFISLWLNELGYKIGYHLGYHIIAASYRLLSQYWLTNIFRWNDLGIASDLHFERSGQKKNFCVLEYVPTDTTTAVW